MKMFVEPGDTYLCREPVDFRKAINGLVVLVEQQMQLSPFASALFVFCNKKRDKLKVLYLDQTGFCLRPPGMVEGRATQEQLPSINAWKKTSSSGRVSIKTRYWCCPNSNGSGYYQVTTLAVCKGIKPCITTVVQGNLIRISP